MHPLFITRIKLKNVKNFVDLDVSLSDQSKSLLISGDNGNGKSSFLRAIALGLADKMGAYSLMSELTGSWVNYGATNRKAIIEIYLGSENNGEYKLYTKIEIFDKYGTEDVVQEYYWKNDNSRYEKIHADEFPFYDLFCTAYGSGLRTVGKERYHQYYHTDSVYQLFKNDATLTEQELSVRRVTNYSNGKSATITQVKKREQQIWDLLTEVLSLPKGWNIGLENNGIFFQDTTCKDRDGNYPRTELTAMGDGIRAITTLLLDVISWWNLYVADIPEDSWEGGGVTKFDLMTKFKDYHGVVIIDEIETHLHPSWQKSIVGSFIKAFPNVQFIFSTHAPLCVSGATDYEDAIKFIRFNKTAEGTGVFDYQLPKGYSADEVLTSEAFGLRSSVSPNTETLIEAVTNSIETETSFAHETFKTMLRNAKIGSGEQKELLWHQWLQQKIETESQDTTKTAKLVKKTPTQDKSVRRIKSKGTSNFKGDPSARRAPRLGKENSDPEKILRATRKAQVLGIESE